MDNLKVRALMVTFWIFAGLALVIAMGQLAVAYQGTQGLWFVGTALSLSALAWCVYRIVLSHLEDDAAEMQRIAEKIRLEEELARLKSAK